MHIYFYRKKLHTNGLFISEIKIKFFNKMKQISVMELKIIIKITRMLIIFNRNLI